MHFPPGNPDRPFQASKPQRQWYCLLATPHVPHKHYNTRLQTFSICSFTSEKHYNTQLQTFSICSFTSEKHYNTQLQTFSMFFTSEKHYNTQLQTFSKCSFTSEKRYNTQLKPLVCYFPSEKCGHRWQYFTASVIIKTLSAEDANNFETIK